ncbi:MAG: OsmC family peroxiredoxin [Candidatus Nitrosothermus koennekii]|nr:MAG: OsmC family peroxiredoxin [Candidatus Nitrosothermus koennekii]
MIINNVDLDKVNKTIENGKSNKDALKKKIALEGEWHLDPNKGYQFSAEVSYEKGKEVLEIDSPSFLGGQGNRLGPMQYCIAGLTSCFIATFASVAAAQGVKLTKLRVRSNCSINFAKTLDIADEPITEAINFEIEAESENADKSRLEELVKMAEERCPAIYSMTHIINTNVTIV